MDKNTVIGFILIGIVLILFTWLNKPTPAQIEARRQQDSIARVEQARIAEAQRTPAPTVGEQPPVIETDSARAEYAANQYGVFASAAEGTDETFRLENDKLEIRFAGKGGRVSYVRLKEYVTHDSLPLILFDNTDSKFDLSLITANSRIINTGAMYFVSVPSSDPNALSLRLYAGSDAWLEYNYYLKPGAYALDFSVKAHGMNGILAPGSRSIDVTWEQAIRQQEMSRKFEDQFTGLFYKFQTNGVENLNQNAADAKKVANRLKWIAYKDKFFSSILVSNEGGFEATTFDSQPLKAEGYLKYFITQTSVPFDVQGEQPTDMQFYFVPNQYKLLKAYDKDLPADEQLDLKKLVPLGYSLFRWMNQYFILPIFAFLCSHIGSTGLAIFLLTFIVKLIIFPMTYTSYMSSAKMRVLRPQIEELNAKYPGSDKAMDRQKATMELYRRAGVNPMAGCLPMLLQMPILFALYWLFPANFDLRQESFLWAKDLSGYDAIFSWSGNIPFLSSFYGNHVSLFCLLMALANVLYTKVNSEMMNTGQQQMPGMKAMMYLMPVMMLFFFNQSAAGLSYYFLISSLISMAQTFGFRFIVNEEKLLAKLEANKKKPMKKTGFMQRLEKMQREQQETLRRQQQQQRGKKK
ncbi:MAG: membrane protein insertase YidC [Tannerellaceae bacterium]|jgi:YidC/Oxa1 family membrane protein insertase|nr:membrane protein insertase YidC [Tannerellaceae bacterium]